jgi:aspartyl/asparaginyl beta-hydroxylase (cupin superfamily)
MSAAAATGDYLLMANDDQLYVDYAWDLALDRVVTGLVRDRSDGVLCLYFDGGQYPEGGQDFPIVSRSWYEALGYFGPTIFQQWSAEKWIFDIAGRIDRLFPVPGVFVEHLHYQDFKAPFDATYQRHRLSRDLSFADQALFLRTTRQREREAAKLREAIDARTTPKEEVAMSTMDQATQPENDVGTQAYITQMARRHYSNLIDAWHFGGRRDQARECAELAVRQGVWDHPLQRSREHIPGLRTQPVHDPAQFWFVSFLEEQYPQIRAEIEQVLDTGFGQAQGVADGAGLLRGGSWEQAPLFKDGQWQEQVCARFPVTTAVLREIPEVTTFSPGTVMVSRLKPGTEIMPHCGPTNTVLRIHLGIRIPPGVYFRVAEQELSWQEGKCLVFDESFEHEVRHEGTEDRIVLILDMLHPEVADDVRERLAQRRLTFEEQILGFMRERGLERIDTRDGELVFHPDGATREVASLYMAATGIVGAELRDGKAVWRRRSDETASHA